MGASAWASETVSFTNRNYMTVVSGADGTLTATGGANNKKYSLATADLSGVANMSLAGTVQIEFDCSVTSGGRWVIGIGDVVTRGTNANSSSSSTYDTEGIISFFGTNEGSHFRINSWSGSRNDNLLSKSVHVTFLLNRITSTYSCTIVDNSDASQKLTASGATTVSNATVVEAYTWSDRTESMSDVTVTVTPAYSYSVNANYGGKLIKQIASGKYLVGDAAIRVAYPQKILKGNTLYSIAMNGSNPRFAKSFTPNADNYVVDLSYAETPVTDVIYFTEAENIPGVSKGSNDSYASMDKMGHTTSSSTYVEVMTLPVGKYTIYARGVNGNAATRTCNFKVGSEIKWAFSIATGTDVNGNSEEFTVTTPSTLYFACDGSSASGCDWFYIKGTIAEGADVTGLIVNANMEIAASGSGFQELAKGWNNCSVVTNYRRLEYTPAQNPNSAFTGTYAYENWTGEAGGLVGKMSQTIQGLPNGVYKFQLAVLAQNIGAQFVYAKSNGKTYSTPLAGAGSVANDYEVIAVVEDNQLEIGLDMNGADNPWAAIDNARLTYAPSVSKSITAAGYATYYSPYALNFSGVDGLSAYIATVAGTTVTFNKVTSVPANTGILLKGAANTYNIPVVASSATDVSSNKLEGVTSNTDKDAGIYVLMNGAKGVGFYKTTTTFTVGANTAYLPADVAGARSFIAFGDETTGIDATLTDNVEMTNDKAFYNLQGQRVAQPRKGLYIVNGKKVIVK